jgi:predicted AAA+ superfamily ATPase
MSDNLQLFRWLSLYLPAETNKRLIVLTGARQTGKTTLAKLVYPKINYINLDAPENREALRNINSARWGKDVGIAILDEAQKEPSIFEKIKYSFDAGDISFSVLLGSAQILLLSKIKESLAGRVFLYELWPLMMTELINPRSISAPSVPMLEKIFQTNSIEQVLNEQPSVLLAEEEAERKEAENYLLKWGGMPELLYLTDEDKRNWLKSYEYTYLERDLADLARLKDLEPFRKLQRVAALRAAKILNFSELSKDAGISIDSARRYLEYLKISYQTILLQPYYENITSSVVKSPKLYFVDIGILRQISGFMGEISGEVYENYVVAEIFKWIKTNNKNIQIYFYHTRSGLELDLLLKTEAGFIGIEIKSGQKLGRADFRSLKAVAESLKEKWLGGICVYRGSKIGKIFEPKIWMVPSYRLFSA